MTQLLGDASNVRLYDTLPCRQLRCFLGPFVKQQGADGAKLVDLPLTEDTQEVRRSNAGTAAAA